MKQLENVLLTRVDAKTLFPSCKNVNSIVTPLPKSIMVLPSANLYVFREIAIQRSLQSHKGLGAQNIPLV